MTSDYLGVLLAAAPADVRARLAEIGEFVLGAENLAAMRSRQLRDPGTPSGAVEHSDRVAPGRGGDADIPVRLHKERAVSGPRPALISIHGGGYVIGSHLGDDGRFDRWSPALRCVGISVGYRLAPETPYPGPLEDCYSALAWAYRNAADLGIDPGRIGIIGGSAGGGLAAGLPPAFVTVGNLDGLLDEDVDYARRLIAAGVPTDLHVFADAPHAFDSMLAGTAVARRAAAVLEEWLAARMHP